MIKIFITKEEEKAIKALERLAKKWPESLSLFSWSGHLIVTKFNQEGIECDIGTISGIKNDGGDPDSGGGDGIDQYAEKIYEV